MPDSNHVTFMQATAEAAAPSLPGRTAPTLAEVLECAPRSDERKRDARGFALRRLLLLADVLALAVAFLAAEVTGGLRSGGPNPFVHDLVLVGIAVPVWILFARAHNLYHVGSRRADHGAAEELAPIIWMTTLWSWSILLVFSVTGMRMISVPKLALFWVFTIGCLVGFRSLARIWARRQVWYIQNALVVGTVDESETVVAKILRHPEYGMNVVACVELPLIEAGGAGAPARIGSFGHVPLIRGDVDVVELLSELDVDRVILGPSLHRLGPEGAEMLTELLELHLHVDIVPSWCEVVGSRVDLHELEGMPLLAVPYVDLARSSLVCKRALDIVISAGALFVLAPFFALCALAIKLDSRGPVLFRQRRVGRHDERFQLYKFRSMYKNADEIKDQVAELSFHGGGTENGMFKIERDPRVTRVGRFLRRTSLDELPQLINVLKGDMSLVGPRPLIENEDRQINGRHRRRISLTPGLTGLWQVHGRSDIPFEDMIDLDYLYVTNWSLWGDVKLLIRTFAAVARGQGAY